MSELGKRLLPLQVATFLQGFALWVPVEKLFLTEIGFDAASIGLMAAAYAALVPVVEIPSGMLADRWSRRGVLMIAGIALAVSTVGGGLSDGVPAYIAAALALGVYFAMFSGTLEAVVYDTVLEETGNSATFERRIGQVRLIESVALVTSALAGGWIASLTGTRSTYFLSIPFVLLSLLALTRFREPTLHRGSEHTNLRRHFAMTYRAILYRGRLLPLVAASIATTVILQSVFEFGPLWLIDLASPAVLYGPFWAVLVATLGLGGLLAGRIDLDRRTTIAGVVAVMIGTGLVLTTAVPFLGVTAAFVTLALLVVVAGIHLTRVMHDAVDSTVRAGVASGVGAVSWLAFVPFALAMGSTSKADGVHTSGWLLTGVIVLAGLALAWTSLRKISVEPERVLVASR